MLRQMSVAVIVLALAGVAAASPRPGSVVNLQPIQTLCFWASVVLDGDRQWDKSRDLSRWLEQSAEQAGLPLDDDCSPAGWSGAAHRRRGDMVLWVELRADAMTTTGGVVFTANLIGEMAVLYPGYGLDRFDRYFENVVVYKAGMFGRTPDWSETLEEVTEGLFDEFARYFRLHGGKR